MPALRGTGFTDMMAAVSAEVRLARFLVDRADRQRQDQKIELAREPDFAEEREARVERHVLDGARDGRGDRESESDQHARGVAAHRHVEELA